MEKQIGLTEARTKLTSVISEVMYKGDTYIISKSGKPAAAVVPLDVWEAWQQTNQPPKRQKLAAAIDELRAESLDSPAAQLDEDALMDSLNELIEEVRDQKNIETAQL